MHRKITLLHHFYLLKIIKSTKKEYLMQENIDSFTYKFKHKNTDTQNLYSGKYTIPVKLKLSNLLGFLNLNNADIQFSEKFA